MMEWAEPKLDWTDADLPTYPDFDRIERNIQYLAEYLSASVQFLVHLLG